MHDLRHTHATLLLKAGVPLKVVSERLGHSSPAFTMTVYQHVLPGMQRAAAELFSTLLRPQESGCGPGRRSVDAAEQEVGPGQKPVLTRAEMVAGAGFEPATFGL